MVDAKLTETEAPPIHSPRTSYIPTLDGWRAIAVTLVIGAHFSESLRGTTFSSSFTRITAGFFLHAGYGVDIFFALSGYLICTLLLREKQRTGTISLSKFYTRRVFRILPPMFLYLIVVALLSALAILPHIDPKEFLAVIFFYRNYLKGAWYTGHFWSLAVEEHFYVFAPLFLLLVRRRTAVYTALVLIALEIVIRAVEFSHPGFSAAPLEFRTENRFDGLLWGCVLALLLAKDDIRAWIAKRLNGWVFTASIAFAIVLLTVFSSQPARRTVVAAIMPLLIGYTMLHAGSPVGRFLELPFLRWIGRLSYSLYIWQQLFVGVAKPSLGPLQQFPLAFILPFVCAALSFYLLEKPMIRLGHRLAASPGQSTAGRLS